MKREPHRVVGWLLAAVVGMASALGIEQACAADALPAAQDFFRHPAMSEPQLSPSGKLLGVLLAGNNGRIRLAVMDLDDPKQSKTVAAISDADVRSFRWVNDRRLVFDAIDLSSPGGDQYGYGLFAVNADGTGFRKLVKHRPPVGISQVDTQIDSRELSWTHKLKATVDDGSDDVIVEQHEYGANRQPLGTSLLRLNTITGRVASLVRGAPSGTYGWLVDWKGEPRATYALQEGLMRIYWHDIAAGTWVQLNESPWHDMPMQLAGIDGGGNFFVRALRADRAGTMALYRYRVAERQLESEPLVSLDGFDFFGELIFDHSTHALVGAQYRTDALGTVWFDPVRRSLQAQVDKALPSTVNTISCRQCAETRHVLVRSASDRQSAVYSLFDPKENRLHRLGASRPWIDPKAMAERNFHRIEARDGQSIPVYVTKPREGKGPWPAVVVVHGGPWTRGADWEWQGVAQFLASRGYVVIEPEFRGSSGFGSRHFRAGFKQWGLAMQDDVADATRWAIKQGTADSDRICIGGSSYGGYSALMGLARDPDLYRCGIALSAVTDIAALYDMHWSDTSEIWKQYGIAMLVGDRDKDAAQFDATSPLKLASRIRQPILIAHGGSDYRVPIEHGARFRDAVSAHNKDVEWVVYPDEGHVFLLVDNKVDFWTRAEKFLARRLASPRTAQAVKSPS
ncbi:MAG TPA: prolyl oligopeptidase family serine peptidase [Albitalea sp.]|uniref:alpha/beta hydrolase family protein n=1 Tax=Piscinibacter sp. TaxID=1903157 RepID=UPI002ED34D38